MKRASREWFKQIMISIVLKKDLDLLKQTMKKEYNINYNLSYADVITILVDNYKKKHLIFDLDKKLRLSMPLTEPKKFFVSYNLD